MVQESLANVIKHGGLGATAHVDLTWRPDQLTVMIRSVGGAPTAHRDALSSGLGLRGLSERIALVGGRFHAGTGDHGEFLVRAELPLHNATADSGPGLIEAPR